MGRHAGPDLEYGGRRRTRCRGGPNGLDRGAMDGRVLAYLELGEVEPEGLDLPSEVLDGAARHPNEPIGHQRALDDIEISEEIAWRLVPAARGSRVAGQVVSTPPEPLGNRPEPAAVGLIGKAPAECGVEVRELVRIVEQPDRQLAIHVRGRDDNRERLHEAGGDGLVAPEDVIGLDPCSVLRDLGRDPGMPVTIATDPAAEPQDRGQRRRGELTTAMGWRDCRQQGALHRGHERVEGRIEEDEGGPDFVERSRDLGPDLGGPPQDHKLLTKTVIERPGRANRQARIIAGLEDSGDTAKGHQRRSTSGLRRMSGEDRMDSQVAYDAQGVRRIVGKSTVASETRNDPRQGVVGSSLLGPTATLLEDPHSMPLLGQVGEAEVQEERADDDLGSRIVEAVELTFERASRSQITGTRANGPATRPGDQQPEVDPGLFLNDLAEQAPQAFDLEPERIRSAHAAIPAPPGEGRRLRSTPIRNVRWTAPQPTRPMSARTFVS